MTYAFIEEAKTYEAKTEEAITDATTEHNMTKELASNDTADEKESIINTRPPEETGTASNNGGKQSILLFRTPAHWGWRPGGQVAKVCAELVEITFFPARRNVIPLRVGGSGPLSYNDNFFPISILLAVFMFLFFLFFSSCFLAPFLSLPTW